MNRAKKWGFITSFAVNGKEGLGMKVFYLLFVDDSFILYDASQEHMEHLSWSCKRFEAILALKINLEKSEFILIGG